MVFYNGTKFTKICHLADIHIRLYKRHEEYRRVFSNLYSDLIKFKQSTSENALIVVAGDIMHAKTDMSPEMVNMASEFFKNLCEIYPTIVIAGNHDMNMSNPNRLDAISPIIENISNDNLHYLKHSGIYTFGNVGFGVHSIIGDKSDWPQASDINSEIKVALYHGPILNAKTDTGYSIASRNVDVSLFDGYDIALLGDIHKYQNLQAYFPDLSPAIAYPGSLIQQNHGETLSGHGWLEWDLDLKTNTFHNVKNEFGYVTITISEGNTVQIPELPENVRLRLFVDNVESTGIKKFLSVLRTKCNIAEVTVNKTSSVTFGEFNSSDNKFDVHDINYQNTLIKNYLQANCYEVSAEVMDRIFEINQSLNLKIEKEDLPRNINWRPIKLKFDNLFSYGEGNEIDFSTMNGLYGVFSPNATGKTSAFDALCFALYDKTPRAFKGSHIMNTREDKCSCELLFEVGGNLYKIIRNGSRRKGGEVKVDVQFLKNNNGEWEELNGEDRRDTNSIIRSYVGDYNDFVLTNLSVQNQNSLFIDKGQSERKDLLSQFMGLTIFDKLYEAASDEIKEIQGSLKLFTKDDFTQQLVDIKSQLELLKKDQDDVHINVNDLKIEIENINSELKQKYEEKLPLDGGNIDIDHLNNEVEKSVSNIKRHNHSILELEDELKKISNSIFDVNAGLVRSSGVDTQYHEFINMKEMLIALNQDFKMMDSKRSEWKQRVEWLSKHEYDPNCKYCVNNIFVKDAKSAEQLLTDNTPEFDKLVLNIEQLKNSIESNSFVVDLYSKRNQDKKYLEQLEKKQLKTQLELEKIKLQISQEENRISELSVQIDKYIAQKEAILINNEIDKEIFSLEEMKSDIQSSLDVQEKDYQQITSKIHILSSKKDDLLSRIKEAEDLETLYEAYEYYMISISRDGIPYQLISEIIPTVQNSVNNILNQVVDFNVILEVDGKNINGRIVYGDERVWPLELASGMEKFVSGLAIRVALMAISSLPRSNFLVLDEGMSVLDSENLSSMFMLFDMLKNEFDFIILISHLDIVRDITDNLIEIKRENGYSYVNV